LRNKTVLKGKLNIKKTIRQSLRSGGHPFFLKYKKRRITKPDIFVLCDVSGSVIHTVKFFLSFLYHLTFAFTKVRSFVFVSKLDELRINKNIHKANKFEELLKSAHIDHYGYSDFGNAFTEFHEKYGDFLTSKTVLIIIGDARNNKKFIDRHELLDRWKKRVKKIIWLNPEQKSKWNTGDSIIGIYENHCDIVAECFNFNHLSKFMNKLVFSY